MHAVPVNPVVVFGILQPDGTVRLDRPPQLPPGPVQITICPVVESRERIPDFPASDTSLPPPFDLPRIGTVRVVQPTRVAHRLPDPVEMTEVA
jgi:hypothetical protein